MIHAPKPGAAFALIAGVILLAFRRSTPRDQERLMKEYLNRTGCLIQPCFFLWLSSLRSVSLNGGPGVKKKQKWFCTKCGQLLQTCCD